MNSLTARLRNQLSAGGTGVAAVGIITAVLLNGNDGKVISPQGHDLGVPPDGPSGSVP